MRTLVNDPTPPLRVKLTLGTSRNKSTTGMDWLRTIWEFWMIVTDDPTLAGGWGVRVAVTMMVSGSLVASNSRVSAGTGTGAANALLIGAKIKAAKRLCVIFILYWRLSRPTLLARRSGEDAQCAPRPAVAATENKPLSSC